MIRPKWIQIPTDLGHALWSALRERLGDDVGVGATCTEDAYVLTEVWTKDTDIPLLRCQTWRHREARTTTLANGDTVTFHVNVTHEHRFSVPVPVDIDAPETPTPDLLAELRRRGVSVQLAADAAKES